MIHASHASFQTKTEVFAWLKTTEAYTKATVDFFLFIFFYHSQTHFLKTYLYPLYFIVNKNFNYHDYQQPAAKRQVKFATRHLLAQSLLPGELWKHKNLSNDFNTDISCYVLICFWRIYYSFLRPVFQMSIEL